MTSELFSDLIYSAYEWLCQRRAHHSPNSDIWDLRFNWHKERTDIVKVLSNYQYQFSPRQQYRFNDETICLLSSRDSLVLKTIALHLNNHIQNHNLLSKSCYHIKHHGGLKKAVRDTKDAIKHYRFVFKTDIQSYHASITHDLVRTELATITNNPQLTKLIHDAITTPITWGGLYFDCNKGIQRGSPLSPLLGAIVLNKLDKAMAQFKGVFYARYMDDWVVLCNSKRKLRKIIKVTHCLLRELGFTLHPDKTYVGKIDKGFDFLGYHFKEETLNIAKITLQRALAKLRLLYEQGASKSALALYWKRFITWTKAGVGDLVCGRAPLRVRFMTIASQPTHLVTEKSRRMQPPGTNSV